MLVVVTEQAAERGYSRLGVSGGKPGPAEWGVLLTLGESMWLTELQLVHDHRPEVLLESGDGWYTEPPACGGLRYRLHRGSA